MFRLKRPYRITAIFLAVLGLLFVATVQIGRADDDEAMMGSFTIPS